MFSLLWWWWWYVVSNSLFFSSVSFSLSNLIMWLASATYCLGTILVVGLIFLEAPFPVGTLFWKTNWDGIEEVKEKHWIFSLPKLFLPRLASSPSTPILASLGWTVGEAWTSKRIFWEKLEQRYICWNWRRKNLSIDQ